MQQPVFPPRPPGVQREAARPMPNRAPRDIGLRPVAKAAAVQRTAAQVPSAINDLYLPADDEAPGLAVDRVGVVARQFTRALRQRRDLTFNEEGYATVERAAHGAFPGGQQGRPCCHVRRV